MLKSYDKKVVVSIIKRIAKVINGNVDTPSLCPVRLRTKLGANLAAHGQVDEGWCPRQPQSLAFRDANAITELSIVQMGNQG